MAILCLSNVQAIDDTGIIETFYWSFLKGKVVGYKPRGVDNQSRLNEF